MTVELPPAAILILGSLFVPLLPRRLKPVWLVALPLLGLWQTIGLFGVEPGEYLTLDVFDYTLSLLRIDSLSLCFALVFHIVALLSVVYSLHVDDDLQHVAGLVYAGSAIGAVFAGDLITLFVFWELTAISSAFLIWARRTERSYRAGMRYIVVQVGSGVILLAGVVLHYQATGSLAFGHLGLGSPGTNLIFIAFGIKCAFPLLHNWLQDAYPEATVTGTVFLSAFTTKLAVYTLARGYAGTTMLIWIGVVMTIFPVFFAVIENDLRRVLAYSLNNQLGFMVVGVGVGTELALNGTVSHAFAHIIYKALLFMSMGAVLYRTGTAKASELGGLYKSMPITAACCMVGAASIAGFPLLSGFISKSMVISAVGEGQYALYFLGLLLASAGVMEHSGIKIPFFAFFSHDSGIRCKEAPANMLVAMIAAALLCIGIGVFPRPLYDILPYPVDYAPYTTTHVVTTLQLLLWATLAFCVLLRWGVYPHEVPSVNLDSDWLYRRALPALYGRTVDAAAALRARLVQRVKGDLAVMFRGVYRHHGPEGLFARTWPTSATVLWIALILGAILVFYYL